jgi:protein-S-isoprenylcysteine O-methyltransferase Ste14
MTISYLVLATLWIVYCVLHSVFAAGSIKHWASGRMNKSFRYYRFGYTIFSFLGLVGILIYQFNIPSQLMFRPMLFIEVAGFIIGLAGAAVMLMMIRKYFMQLSGVRWLFQQQVKSSLEITGLHRFTRHPLYLGTFAFIWGWCLINPSISFFIASFIITVYTIIALKFEEEKLVKEFGESYLEYRKKVPKLIPNFNKEQFQGSAYSSKEKQTTAQENKKHENSGLVNLIK